MTKLPWVTYKLAPDSDKKQRFILTTEDCEIEVCGIIDNDDDAEFMAKACNNHKDLVAALKGLMGGRNIKTMQRAKDILKKL